MTSKREEYNKKAVDFLKVFCGERTAINLVSIDPHSKNVAGITRDISSPDLLEFISENNGKRNLYYMVNEPQCDAPDDKLKKHHVAFIRGVWLDADPAKDKPLDDERIRLKTLMDKLKTSDNPPTYIIDSGGGYQAFWLLKQPVGADPERVELYESLSRGLAQQYETDFVQNIDRIMRIPFTMNLPTAKKKKLGRKPALATVIHAASKQGTRYDEAI